MSFHKSIITILEFDVTSNLAHRLTHFLIRARGNNTKSSKKGLRIRNVCWERALQHSQAENHKGISHAYSAISVTTQWTRPRRHTHRVTKENWKQFNMVKSVYSFLRFHLTLRFIFLSLFGEACRKVEWAREMLTHLNFYAFANENKWCVSGEELKLYFKWCGCHICAWTCVGKVWVVKRSLKPQHLSRGIFFWINRSILGINAYAVNSTRLINFVPHFDSAIPFVEPAPPFRCTHLQHTCLGCAHRNRSVFSPLIFPSL